MSYCSWIYGRSYKEAVGRLISFLFMYSYMPWYWFTFHFEL